MRCPIASLKYNDLFIAKLVAGVVQVKDKC
jgi:hypothetical protein